MSRRIRLALIGIVILGVALAVFFLLINPMRGDIDDLHRKIDEESIKIVAAQQELAQAEQTRREGRLNQGRLLELAKMIPSESEIPSLILQIQDLADKAGIDWMQVSPANPSFTEGMGYGTLQLSLLFEGSFYDISDFIYRAEQMVAGPGRLLAVKDVSLSPGEISGGGKVPYTVVLKVNMSMSAFVVAPEAVVVPVTETTETTEQ